MSANVFTFPSRAKGPQPWTNDELAELYRVVDLLGRAGLAVVTDMGMSDEGDPWFVFCRADNEEVIAHFARIDGHFVAASIAVDETFRGANFRQIVDRMVSSQPLVVPKPGSGSRLLLHPAVLLTAFVATALAHSEKMLAQDLMRSVEAQWEHGKAAALNEVKHIKTAWADTLQGLLKLPFHDSRLAHDSVKETQALSLASLIAIAMTALQPIAEKIAVIARIVADEFPGHHAAAQAQAAHAAQMALEGQGADLAGPAGDHGNGRSHPADDASLVHKIAAPGPDAPADGQKVAPDASQVLAAVGIQKTAADDAGHAAPVHSADAADAAGALLLLQQKTAAMAAMAQPQPQPAEPAAIHLELGSSFIPTINLQDVTQEAQQFLNIHETKPDSGDAGGKTQVTALTPPPSSSGTAPISGDASTPVPSPAPAPAAQVNDSQSSPVIVTPAPVETTWTGTKEINTFTANGVDVINAISNFVTSGTHTVANPSAMNFSASLQQELAGYFTSGSNSLTIIVFDGNAPKDVFSFAPGVVFVADKDLTPNSLIINHGGNLALDVTGGTVTLVGVATIDHSAAV